MTPGPDQADTTERPGDDVSTEQRRAPSPLQLVGRGLVVVVVLGSFLIWIYAFSGAAERDAPDLLDDPAFSTAAETLCSAAQEDLDAMPNALDAIDEADRANQIRQSTARLELMLDELDKLEVNGSRDLEITGGWLSDWRVMVEDRYTYADAIEADPNAQFYVTDVGVSERLDKRLTRLANTNSMPSCAAPQDVG